MTKQKLYRVRFRNVAGFNHYYLNYEEAIGAWSIDSIDEGRLFRTSFTKEELKKQVLCGYLIVHLQMYGSYYR